MSLPGPLCGLLTYDPSFKGLCNFTPCITKNIVKFLLRLHCNSFFGILVEVRLHEPLWKVQFSSDDVAIEVLTLCSQLEPLCKREYAVRNLKTPFTFQTSSVCLSFNQFMILILFAETLDIIR